MMKYPLSAGKSPSSAPPFTPGWGFVRCGSGHVDEGCKMPAEGEEAAWTACAALDHMLEWCSLSQLCCISNLNGIYAPFLVFKP